jgi:predicted anti-sigma-YlaC factor YlaD
MNGTRVHDHDWALPRLTAYSVGMLSEDDTLQLEQHLGGCDDCRARLGSLQPVPGADAAHLPASLIATWTRSARLLGGLERSLIESHLRSCDSCRATLTFAGHEPFLPPQALTTAHRAVRAAARRPGWGWAWGLSGVAAAAAAWLLVMQPALFQHDSHTSATMGSLAPDARHTVTFEVMVLAATPGALLLPEGNPAAGGVPAIEVGHFSAEAGVVLVLPASLRPATPEDGQRVVTLTLIGDGRELGLLRSDLSSLGNALRLRSIKPLSAGEYRLRLSIAASERTAAPQVLLYPLRVR